MTSPPTVPRPAATGPEALIVVVFASAALLGGLFVFASHHGAFGWPCAWKACTGLPCPSCGGTRALLLLASGRWLDAVQMNPGVVVVAAGLAAANLYAAAVLLLRLPPLRPRWLTGGAWRWFLLAALLANWIYLLAAGAA